MTQQVPVGELQVGAWIAALGRMSGRHPDMARILGVVERLQDRPYRSHVIIYGEPGTGKEGLAKLLHRLMHAPSHAELSSEQPIQSPPLSRLSLLGLSTAAMESVFAEGVLGKARGGSVIIDEILELSPVHQRRLYDELSQQRWESPGESAAVIAITDGDLDAAVMSGRLRHDLAYKLGRIVLRVPPLRERPEDLSHSALWMVNRILRSRGDTRVAELSERDPHAPAPTPGAYRVSEEALMLLKSHDFPGNFRELEAVLERAVLLHSDGEELQVAAVRRALGDSFRDRDRHIYRLQETAAEARESLLGDELPKRGGS